MAKVKKTASGTEKKIDHKEKLKETVAKMRDMKAAFAEKLKEAKSAAHAAGYKKGFAEAQQKKGDKNVPSKKTSTKGTQGKSKATAKSKAPGAKKRDRPKKT